MASKKSEKSSPFEKLRSLKEVLAKEERAAAAPHDPAARRSPGGREAPLASGRSASPRTSQAERAGSSSEPRQVARPTGDAGEMQRWMAGVTPLAPAGHRRVSRAKAALDGTEAERLEVTRERLKADAASEAEAVLAHLRALVDEGAPRFEVQDDGRYVEGRRSDVPAQALRLLRQGRLPLDGRVDLHGLRVHEAEDLLAQTLRTHRARGDRCVLVIHGKGHHSPGARGILRGEISAWLSQGAPAGSVAAFATATADDGGEGALYVLLRQ